MADARRKQHERGKRRRRVELVFFAARRRRGLQGRGRLRRRLLLGEIAERSALLLGGRSTRSLRHVQLVPRAAWLLLPRRPDRLVRAPKLLQRSKYACYRTCGEDVACFQACTEQERACFDEGPECGPWPDCGSAGAGGAH